MRRTLVFFCVQNAAVIIVLGEKIQRRQRGSEKRGINTPFTGFLMKKTKWQIFDDHANVSTTEKVHEIIYYLALFRHQNIQKSLWGFYWRRFADQTCECSLNTSAHVCVHGSPPCLWECAEPAWPWQSCPFRWFWAVGSCRRGAAAAPRSFGTERRSWPSVRWSPDGH